MIELERQQDKHLVAVERYEDNHFYVVLLVYVQLKKV